MPSMCKSSEMDTGFWSVSCAHHDTSLPRPLHLEHSTLQQRSSIPLQRAELAQDDSVAGTQVHAAAVSQRMAL